MNTKKQFLELEISCTGRLIRNYIIKEWSKNSKYHRTDGPARIQKYGEQYWENGSMISERYWPQSSD